MCDTVHKAFIQNRYSEVIENYKTSNVSTSCDSSAFGNIDTDPLFFSVLFWVVVEKVTREVMVWMLGLAVAMEQAMME
jgi:hypothetical protein